MQKIKKKLIENKKLVTISVLLMTLIVISPNSISGVTQNINSSIFERTEQNLEMDHETVSDDDLPYDIGFILPEWGGAMVHSNPQLTDNIRLPIPTDDVDIQWHRNEKLGEIAGTWGNGIAGNGKIAACTFNAILKDNLVIYDYDGNYIWSSGWVWEEYGLNAMACSSTPMIDIYDRVVACDNQKIIMVDASDVEDVSVEWVSEIPHNGTIFYPIPFSPNIVDNRTIILPTQRGPLLAYDVATGDKIAEIKLGEGEVTLPIYGIPEMPWDDYLYIISHPLNCPYYYNSEEQIVEWVSTIEYGIPPIRNTFCDGNIAFVPTPDGYVCAYDITSGSLLACNVIGEYEPVYGDGYFSTINSACVKGNRIYLATEYSISNFHPFDNTYGRLYAVDVNPDAEQEADRLQVAWYFNYNGQGQASPTMINDTIYFDAYRPALLPENRDPHIYAITDKGDHYEEKWNISYPNITWFSFSMDPRGGFWYEDCDTFGAGKLVRFSEEDGSILEELDGNDIVNEYGVHYTPFSCMTICGTEDRPRMIVSVVRPIFSFGSKYVVAIDLAADNSVLWKVPIESPLNLNYVDGQYTILMNDDEPRILFGTFLDGVMAIGNGDGDDQVYIVHDTQQSAQSI